MLRNCKKTKKKKKKKVLTKILGTSSRPPNQLVEGSGEG